MFERSHRLAAATAIALTLSAGNAEAVVRVFDVTGTTSNGDTEIMNGPAPIDFIGQYIIDGSVVGETVVEPDRITYTYRDALRSFSFFLANGEQILSTGPTDIELIAFLDPMGIVEEIEFEALDPQFLASAGLQGFSDIDDIPKTVNFTIDQINFDSSGEDPFDDLATLATLPYFDTSFTLRYASDVPFVTLSPGGGSITGFGNAYSFRADTIVESSVVPLPAGALLLVTGLLALGAARRTRRHG